MAEIPISFAVNAGELIATVTGTGDGGVENGLLLQSSSFTSDGSVAVDLGAAVQSISSFNFFLGDDTADFIVAIDASQTLAVLDVTGQTGVTGPTPTNPSTLSQFWGSATQGMVTAALSGALETWIETNASGVPVLILVGFVSGGSAFLLASGAMGADLFALFITQLAVQEVDAGAISQDQAADIKQWAKIGDLVAQIPAIIEDEEAVSRIASGLAADVNFESDSDDVKLSVSIASNTTSKYVLALKALKP